MTNNMDQASVYSEDYIEAADGNGGAVMMESGGGTFEVSNEHSGLELSDKNGVFAVVPPAPQQEEPEAAPLEAPFGDEPPRRKRKGYWALGLLYVLLGLVLIVGMITYLARRGDDGSSSRDFSSAISDPAASQGDGAGGGGIDAGVDGAPTVAPTAADATGGLLPTDPGTDGGAGTTTNSPTPLAGTIAPTQLPTTGDTASPTQAPTIPCANLLTIDSTCYADPTSLALELTNCDPQEDDWVGIFPAPAVTSDLMGDNYVAWAWTCGSRDCRESPSENQFDMPLPELANGMYQAYLLRNTETNDGPFPTILASPVFEVTDGVCTYDD
mmetsp:Transcript_14326/g.40768  ORF Transcript_14326/g.40768 Transcript_14326/m.40768 type:complete len:327 (+) Transcript_14326:375-1355(+)